MIDDCRVVYHENEVYDNYKGSKRAEMDASISSEIELWWSWISDDLEIRQSRDNCVDKELN